MKYAITPNTINFNQLLKKKRFTPSNYNIIPIKNDNLKLVKDLLSNYVVGKDIGSDFYLSFDSNYYFMKTKSAQSYSFLPIINTDTQAQPICPSAFKKYKEYYNKNGVKFNLNKGDILIVKDSNVGEVVYINKDMPNYIIAGGLVKLELFDEIKFYVLAMMKTDFFKEQLQVLTPKGSTITHAGKLWLDLKIPFPNNDDKNIIEYVSTLVKAVISREEEIHNKYIKIMDLIYNEIKINQKEEKFKYAFPKFSELKSLNRMDSAIYSPYLKEQEFLLKNYEYGFKTLEEWGFEMGRGQNLQISAIGESIESDDYYDGYYKVIKPSNISIYGTVLFEKYLGNPNELKTLKNGDIIFGAEGFEKGRSLIVIEDTDKAITNIHGVTLNHSNSDMIESIYIKCFLDYLRSIGLIDIYGVGGNGGSIALPYLKKVPFPIFPEDKQKEIADLYFMDNEYNNSLDFNNFEIEDKKMIKNFGIYQLDYQKNLLKHKILEIVNKIIDDEKIIIGDCPFDFIFQ